MSCFVAALDKARFETGGYCEVCKMAVTYIDRILEKNATEAQIEDAVRRVCSFLPDSFQSEVSCCSFACVILYLCYITALL